MKLKSPLFLLTLCLFSCNMLLFQNPMPIAGKIVHKIPCSFFGKYLSLDYTENKVSGSFKTIKKQSTGHYLVEYEEVVFLDSLNWAKQGLGAIDTVIIKKGKLEIKTKKRTISQAFADTISSKGKDIIYEMDLQNGWFYNFELGFKEVDREEARLQCQLRFLDGFYYLNTQGSQDNWLVSKIGLKGKELSITHTYSSTQGEHEKIFADLAKQYNFKKIEKEDGSSSDDYLANPSPSEFNQILAHPIFERSLWIKIESDENCSFFSKNRLGFGLLAVLMLLILVRLYLKSRKVQG